MGCILSHRANTKASVCSQKAMQKEFLKGGGGVTHGYKTLKTLHNKKSFWRAYIFYDKIEKTEQQPVTHLPHF
jgi:hypothetical protein